MHFTDLATRILLHCVIPHIFAAARRVLFIVQVVRVQGLRADRPGPEALIIMGWNT